MVKREAEQKGDGPINIYDWAATLYGFNEKCRRPTREGGEEEREWRFRDGFGPFSYCSITKFSL